MDTTSVLIAEIGSEPGPYLGRSRIYKIKVVKLLYKWLGLPLAGAPSIVITKLPSGSTIILSSVKIAC